MNLYLSKTGILTSSTPKLREIFVAPFIPASQELALLLAATAQRQVDNPLAISFRDEASIRGLNLGSLEKSVFYPGSGVEAYIDGKKVLVGNRGFMERKFINHKILTQKAEQFETGGDTTVYLSVEGQPVALFIFDNELLLVEKTLQALRDQGFNVIILSGDHKATVSSIAEALGIDRFQAEMGPEEKAQHFIQERFTGRLLASVAMHFDHHLPQGYADMSILVGGHPQDRPGFVYNHEIRALSDLPKLLLLEKMRG